MVLSFTHCDHRCHCRTGQPEPFQSLFWIEGSCAIDEKPGNGDDACVRDKPDKRTSHPPAAAIRPTSVVVPIIKSPTRLTDLLLRTCVVEFTGFVGQFFAE